MRIDEFFSDSELVNDPAVYLPNLYRCWNLKLSLFSLKRCHSSSDKGSYRALELRLVDDGPVGAFDVDIAETAEEATFDDIDAAEEAFIWLGAGDAVLWLDTESGRAVSSITISPGEPGFVIDWKCFSSLGIFFLAWHVRQELLTCLKRFSVWYA